jgi:hypothetical protein
MLRSYQRWQRALHRQRTADITRLIADLPARAERAVMQLERTAASGDIPRAREEIRTKVGSVTVEADKREVRLYSEHGDVAALLLRVPGSHASIDGRGGSSLPPLLAAIPRLKRRGC